MTDVRRQRLFFWHHPPEIQSTENGDVKIPLTRGLYALVSPEDSDLLTESWHIVGSKILYAARSRKLSEAHCPKNITMHRIILERVLGRPLCDGEECDHINRDALDNRRPNLRIATHSQNCQNRSYPTGISGHRGVSFSKQSGKWRAFINLGTYATPEEAAIVWKKAAALLRGEFVLDEE